MGKIDAIAQERGEAAEEFIPRLIREHGSIHKAAIALGVYPNAIRHWMGKNNFRLVVRRSIDLEKVN